MDNIWYVILDYTDDPFIYKYTYLVSSILRKNYKQDKIKEFSNHLFILLKLFPNENWNWKSLSGNPAVTWDMLKLDYPWNWKSISKRFDLTEDIIIKYLNKPWNLKKLTYNRNISRKFLNKNFDKNRDFSVLTRDVPIPSYAKYHCIMGWNYYLSYENVSWESVVQTNGEGWDFNALSHSTFRCKFKN